MLAAVTTILLIVDPMYLVSPVSVFGFNSLVFRTKNILSSNTKI